MPSKILLISANRCTRPDPVFPLGLTHLSAALRRAGHHTAWLDLLANIAQLDGVIESYRPDFVGLSLRNIDDVLINKRETFFDDTVSLGARIRQKTGCPIIVGGSGFSLFPERLLELAGADFGVRGEGEPGLVALISALETGGSLTGISGLVTRHERKIIVNPSAPAAFDGEYADADRPGPVTRHYLQTSGVLNLQTQRGCGFRCGYCTYPLIEGRRHRRRPPELVAEEFAQLQRLGARYVFIVDSIFNSSVRHVTEVCEALLRRNVKMSWGCFLRPHGLTADLVKLMARAGLSHIEFGSDSFCDEVLAAYQKDFSFDDICRSNELARQEHLDVCHFLICGGPGESRETLARSFANSHQLQGAVMMAVVGTRIYPGTGLFQQAVNEGQIDRNADLLIPQYYLAPGLTAEAIQAQLQQFAASCPNWVVGDPGPGYASLVERLRQRGVVGPLWSYFAMLQRIQPRANLIAR
jgi:radical SAM superfamily enzyme YgiQ (UPF0313 family)